MLESVKLKVIEVLDYFFQLKPKYSSYIDADPLLKELCNLGSSISRTMMVHLVRESTMIGGASYIFKSHKNSIGLPLDPNSHLYFLRVQKMTPLEKLKELYYRKLVGALEEIVHFIYNSAQFARKTLNYTGPDTPLPAVVLEHFIRRDDGTIVGLDECVFQLNLEEVKSAYEQAIVIDRMIYDNFKAQTSWKESFYWHSACWIPWIRKTLMYLQLVLKLVLVSMFFADKVSMNQLLRIIRVSQYLILSFWFISIVISSRIQLFYENFSTLEQEIYPFRPVLVNKRYDHNNPPKNLETVTLQTLNSPRPNLGEKGTKICYVRPFSRISSKSRPEGTFGLKDTPIGSSLIVKPDKITAVVTQLVSLQFFFHVSLIIISHLEDQSEVLHW